MKTRIFHTVNAGLYIESPGARLLVDGLHGGRAEGCSPLPDQLAAQAETGTGLFFDLNGLLFTHLHGDHFDPVRTAQVLALPGAPRLLGASFDPEKRSFTLEMAERRLHREDMDIHLLPTRHDGEMFAYLPHNSVLLKTPDASLFLAGDAFLDTALAQRVAALWGPSPLQALFINPIQLLSQGGKDFLRALPAKKIFVCHIPFPEDDIYMYGQSCKWAVRACQAEFPNLSIPAHMQWVELF